MVVGMTVMRKANVVIRDLSALEALGGVTNICSDKTGTLTQGAMIVKKLWLPKVGIYTVNNSMDPNDPTQGTVTKGPEVVPQKPVEEEKADYDHERSAAAMKYDDDSSQKAPQAPTGLKFDVPAAKMEKDQNNNVTRRES